MIKKTSLYVLKSYCICRIVASSSESQSSDHMCHPPLITYMSKGCHSKVEFFLPARTKNRHSSANLQSFSIIDFWREIQKVNVANPNSNLVTNLNGNANPNVTNKYFTFIDLTGHSTFIKIKCVFLDWTGAGEIYTCTK